jgi:RHS repeat-associated protein
MAKIFRFLVPILLLFAVFAGMAHTYDRDGRLLERFRESEALGHQVEKFAWDEADNHRPIAANAERFADGRNLAPVKANRLLGWLFKHAGIEQEQRLEYDAFGRLIQRQNAQGAVTQNLYWDEDDRLIAVEDDKGATAFAYDALGRRSDKWHVPGNRRQSIFHYKKRAEEDGERLLTEVSRSLDARHIRFVWEGMRLLQEIDSSRVRSWIYEPDGTGYVPLAAIDQGISQEGKVGKPKVHYVHTDHLGTPQEMTDADGKIEWSAEYTAWGQRQYALPLNADEESEIRVDCALRFQGQYFDAETGLHYNTFRYYDPGCGRFISPDPINILGGLNLYQAAIPFYKCSLRVKHNKKVLQYIEQCRQKLAEKNAPPKRWRQVWK